MFYPFLQAVDSNLNQVVDKMSDALDVRKISSAAASSSSGNGEGDGGSAAPGGAALSSSSVPGRVSGMPGAANMAAFRATLWNNVESVLDFIHNK